MSKRQRGAEVSNQADVARRGLVSVNRLDYTLQPDLSVAVARSSKKHFFQQQSYNHGQRAICILNSGAEYIDPQNSYLKFNITTGVADHAADSSLNLGVGSGCNFIKQIILTSRSGDELERIEQVNQLAPVLDRYMNSANWLNTHGDMIGYYNGTETSVSATTVKREEIKNNQGIWEIGGTTTGADLPSKGQVVPAGATAVKTFVIPLGCISGLFKSFDRLLPSMLCSGLRLEIEWETAVDVGMWGSAVTTPSYTVNDLEIVLDQYQLTDSIMRVLNEEAAIRGLEVVFSTWYNHDSAQNKSQSASVQVRKAVSRALGLLHRMQRTKSFSLVKDNFLSYVSDLVNYQVRIGALYFPQQGITSTNIDTNNIELYHHTMRGLGKWKTPNAPTGCTLQDFRGNKVADAKDNGTTATPQSFQAIYTDLERSNTQKLTGIPVNNARVAEIMLSHKNAPLNDYRVNSYLHYVRLLRVFLQNIEVEE